MKTILANCSSYFPEESRRGVVILLLRELDQHRTKITVIKYQKAGLVFPHIGTVIQGL